MTRDDVLIIGARPSGLFAAAELARHGVEARLIERELRPHREARATAIQPGTLEICPRPPLPSRIKEARPAAFSTQDKVGQVCSPVVLVISGGNRTPMELFLAGPDSWDRKIRMRLMIVMRDFSPARHN